MSCASFESRIALLVEGDLPGGEAREVEAHLEACPHCRAVAYGQAASQSALKNFHRQDLDPQVYAEVRQRVMKRLTSKPRRAFIFGWRYAWAGALLSLLLAAGLVWKRRPSEPLPRVTRVVEDIEESRSAVPVTARKRIVRRRRKPRPSPPEAKPAMETEPLVVKFVTDDPNIVIIWLVEKTGD